MLLKNQIIRAILIFGLVLIESFLPVLPVSADPYTTTSVTITKYAVDGETINRQITLSYQWMRDNLPVEGDGDTRYYHQGMVNVEDDNETTRWNEEETENFYDFGLLQGTRVDILCDQVGGMKEGDILHFKGSDGWPDYFAYKNVYEYSSREGPMVLTWCKDGEYPDSGYSLGMRLVWFADTSTNPNEWHIFGNWDWHEAADEEYWYYFDGKYPTTSGLSGKYIAQMTIESSDPPYWDPDESGECDLGDIESIASNWHNEGDPYWIPEDNNGDGTVNILDAVLLGENWEKNY